MGREQAQLFASDAEHLGVALSYFRTFAHTKSIHSAISRAGSSSGLFSSECTRACVQVCVSP
jgi:hypothetical protein